MDTFRGGATAGDNGVQRRIAGLDPNLINMILVLLVIIILVILLINMSSASDSSGSGTAAPTAGRGGFFNPLNNAMRNAPVVTTATTTRAV